jgi:mono/diheme cytochrome c family protein
MKPTKLTAALAALSVVGVVVPATAQDADIVKHMHDKHEAMIAIQSAIIAGSLDGTRESATSLLEHEEPAGLPPAGAEFTAAVRVAAQGVLDADSLVAAAEAASQMGLACGRCHQASGVTVEFDDVKQPSDKEKEKPHMQRHQWAADRMWEGLIGPSSVAWSRGANLLFESPIKPDVLAQHGGGDEIVGMSRRIHQLAANATAVSAPEEQAEIYAEFIANCGSCHTELGEGSR